MTKISLANLGDVPQTLVIPLYFRAMESQRPDAMLHDGYAAEILAKLDCNVAYLKGQEMEQVFVIMRSKEFDRCSQHFMEQHPQAVVVHLACGLDTRFERIDNGLVEWFDLDLPEVMAVRALLKDEKPRCHRLASSALDFAWMDAVKPLRGRPFLFLAEGFFAYLSQAEVKQLVLGLKENFPGSELMFDSTPPILKYMSSLHPELKHTHASVRWGLGNSHTLESWGSGICLLSEWYYFTQTEPRLKPYRWMRFVPVLGKGYKIVHYRLGK